MTQPGRHARSALLFVALAGAAVGVAPHERARADALSFSTAELSSLAAQLASASGDKRRSALAELCQLRDDDLPSLHARLAQLSASKLDRKALLAKLPALQRVHALGARASRGDQAVGLELALEQDRSPAMLVAVELIALLRALEGQRSPAAGELIVNELFVLEPRLFRSEFVGTRKRLGKLLVPGLLRARAQGDQAMQKLARESLVALGMSSDERLFAESNTELLAANLRVAGELGQASALPWFVGLLDDARPAVRSAARAATERHAEATLDLLRQRTADLIGEEPDPSWTAQHVLERLLQQLEAARDRDALQALSKAQPALRSGDLAAVAQQLALAVETGVSSSTRGLAAATYLELAARYDTLDRASDALSANRRAWMLAPRDSQDAVQARARALYLEAERRTGRGIADLQTLEQAARLEPAQPAASELLEELRGLRLDRAHELRRRLGLLAAGLLGTAALLVLYIRAQAKRALRQLA